MLSQVDRFELMAMHEYRRPHGAPAEEKFIARFIKPLGVQRDTYGNHYKIIGEAPRVLWSCHTDTVHRVGGRQRLAHWGGILRLASGQISNCLGADDTAGVWMLTHMIKRKIPGLYVFHRGEEIGCLGSRHFATHSQALLDGIDMAIAFDRAGKRDVIDHQMGQRCASTAFAKSLAAGLGMGHKPCHGMYTDTATYMKLVPECSNVSVGYEGAHWRGETLDMAYLARLRDAVFSLKVNDLVVERDPTVEEEPWWKRSGRIHHYGDEQPWGHPVATMPKVQPDYSLRHKRGVELAETFGGKYDAGDWVKETRLITLEDFCKAFPQEVADYLETLGVNAADLKDHLDAAGGMRLDELFKGNGVGTE